MTAAPRLPEIHVEEQAAPGRVREFCAQDRLLTAYALADLDAADVERARWWTATRDDHVIAAALVVEALAFKPCFASGDAEALAAIFREGVRESRLVVSTPPAGRPPVAAAARLARVGRVPPKARGGAALPPPRARPPPPPPPPAPPGGHPPHPAP